MTDTKSLCYIHGDADEKQHVLQEWARWRQIKHVKNDGSDGDDGDGDGDDDDDDDCDGDDWMQCVSQARARWRQMNFATGL